MPAAASDHDGPALELRIAQQLDRRVERIHVEMRDESGGWGRHGGGGVTPVTAPHSVPESENRLMADGENAIKSRARP